MTVYQDNLQVEQLHQFNQVAWGNRTQALANSTLTLVATDAAMQVFTGSTSGQIVRLPDATTLLKGWRYDIFNTGTVTLTVNDGSGANLLTLAQTSISNLTLIDNSTPAGLWAFIQFFSGVASGIVNYNVTATATFTTTSATDVLLTTMSVSPTAGTYGVWFTAAWNVSNANAVARFTVYNNGVAVTDSLRDIDSPGGGAAAAFATQTAIQITAGNAVDVRARTTSGTLTVTNRNLLLIRLGN